MTQYLGLPDDRRKLEQLTSIAGTEVLPSPPCGLDEVPAGRALVCVADMGEYEAAAYLITETDFAKWVNAACGAAKTWLLLDRKVADQLCPEAAAYRAYQESGVERESDAEEHPDNLIPVARASRGRLRMNAQQLRMYAAVLRGETQGNRFDNLRTDTGAQQVAAADLDDIARDLESWAEQDWLAVINLSARRQHLAGPLPPFPLAATPDLLASGLRSRGN